MFRRLARIALTGMVCVLAVLVAGRITERLVLGQDDAAVRARVERDVREAFGACRAACGKWRAASPMPARWSRRAATTKTPRASFLMRRRRQPSRRRATWSSRSPPTRPAVGRWPGLDVPPSCRRIASKVTKPGSSHRARSAYALSMRCPSTMPPATASARSRPSNRFVRLHLRVPPRAPTSFSFPARSFPFHSSSRSKTSAPRRILTASTSPARTPGIWSPRW